MADQPGAALAGLKELQGTWYPSVVCTASDQRLAGFSDGDTAMSIEKDKWQELTLIDETTTVESPNVYRIVLDTSTRPRSIDLRDGQDYVVRGIYRVDGNALTIVQAPAGKPRPKNFDLAEDSEDVLSVFRSERPVDKDAVIKQFGGKWRLVTEIRGGETTNYGDEGDSFREDLELGLNLDGPLSGRAKHVEGNTFSLLTASIFEGDDDSPAGMYIRWDEYVADEKLGDVKIGSTLLYSDLTRAPLWLDWRDLGRGQAGVGWFAGSNKVRGKLKGIGQVVGDRLYLAYGQPEPEEEESADASEDLSEEEKAERKKAFEAEQILAERPAYFVSSKNDKSKAVRIFQRIDKEQPAEQTGPQDSELDQAVKEELAKLQGTWNLVSRAGFDGELKNVKNLQMQVRIAGDSWTTLVKNKETGTAKLILDPTASPKAMDRLESAEEIEIVPGKGVTGRKKVQQRALCIYKIEGDSLTVATQAQIIETRPENFDVERTAAILSVYKRVAK